MFQIVRREQFPDQTFQWEIDAPDVARVAQPATDPPAASATRAPAGLTAPSPEPEKETTMLCPQCHQPLADDAEEPYICCAGAPMQWHCLQCGKVSEGFALPYGRCPHCSGELELRGDGETLANSDASRAAIRMAFEIELGGRAFYQRAAADSGDPQLRALFERFAIMEGEHMETLARRFHVEIPDPMQEFRLELAAIFAEVKNRPQDPANLFRIAIALEQRAAAFFSSHADHASPDSAEQHLYRALAAEEHEHAALLATEFTRWSERKPGLFGATAQSDAGNRRLHADTSRTPMNAAALLLDGHDADAIALICGEQELRYGQLRRRVACAAAVWRARGLRSGDRVAIKLPDGIDWVVAFLGTIWAGGVAVAVNPHIPAPEWHYILNEAGFNVIVAESHADTPAPWRARVILLADGQAAVAQTEPIAATLVDEDTPAFWCHSSGTSGKPKAVVHGHRFAREIERVSSERLGIASQDRLFASSRLFFSYPQTNSLYAGLKIGATVVLDPGWPDAHSVAVIVARTRPSVLFSVPSLYRNLLQLGLASTLKEHGVRLCVSAGEPLAPALRRAWRDATGLPLVDGYGASEVQVLVLTERDGDDSLQPSPGVEVRELDAQAASAGLPTRLCFRVATQALGYLDRPAAQAEHFRNGGFCPADLFVRSGNGWQFAGREDAMVKIAGRWVDLVALENSLGADLPDLLESAVARMVDTDGVGSLALFYVARPGAAASVKQVLQTRCQQLTPHQRPRWVLALDALPRTATGKLLRRELAALSTLASARKAA